MERISRRHIFSSNINDLWQVLLLFHAVHTLKKFDQKIFLRHFENSSLHQRVQIRNWTELCIRLKLVLSVLLLTRSMGKKSEVGLANFTIYWTLIQILAVHTQKTGKESWALHWTWFCQRRRHVCTAITRDDVNLYMLTEISKHYKYNNEIAKSQNYCIIFSNQPIASYILDKHNLTHSAKT